MSDPQAALRAAIAALEAQRPVLGDAVVDAALAPLRRQLGEDAPQLRLVSVLFLDIVGSTSLTQRLDPEQVHDVMDGALAAYTACVQAHRGTVLQYAGDSLLAVFGHPRSAEDDAERAVRCALALLAEARRQGAGVLERHRHDGFDVRLGVHTGRVLIGAGVDAEHGIRGMTVNVAARLEQAAAPGTVLISHDTWRQVEGLFDTEARPPMLVKGRDAPLASWRVLAARPADRAERRRGIDGVASPLTGREHELGTLLADWARAAVRTVPRAGPVARLVLADAGLGKSRLAAEFQQQLEAAEPRPALVLHARAHAEHRLQPYRLLRDLLLRWLGVSDSDDAAQACAQFEHGLAPWLPPGDVAPAHRLGQLVGLDFSASPHVTGADARQLRNWGVAALAVVLDAVAAHRGAPLLVVADDLHWADASSVDALLHLAGTATLPAMVLMLARPQVIEQHAALADAGVRRLELPPLAPIAGAGLAAALLRRIEPPPTALAAELAERAGGNPYYLEELIKMLIDDGVIVPGESPSAPWLLHEERLALDTLPGTLVGVLQARLDALAAASRGALQRASVIGPVFWDDALACLDAAAPASLPDLQRRALVRRRELSAFEGTAEEAFAHHLLQQVTYDTVLRADRRAGHAAAARWLAERAGGRSSEHLAITAQHFLRAGETAAAAEWFVRAAEHAVARFDNASAFELLREAQALVSATSAALGWRLARAQISLADRVGDRELHEQGVRSIEALAAATPDDPEWAARARYSRGLLLMRRGEHAAALAALDEAIALAEAAGAPAACAEACNLAVVLTRIVGDAEALRARAALGLERARAAGDRSIELRITLNRAALDFSERRHALARRVLAGSIPAAQALNLPAVELVLRVNVLGCHVELADAEAACRDAPAALALAEALGDIVHGAVARTNHASALLQLGRLDEALAQATAGWQALEAREALLALFAEQVLAQVEHELGRFEPAAARHARLADRFLALDQAPLTAESHVRHAMARHALGDAEGAQRALAPLRAPTGPTPLAEQLPMTAAWELHRLLARLGDAEAGRWLERCAAMLDAHLAAFEDPAEAAAFLRMHPAARGLRAAGIGR